MNDTVNRLRLAKDRISSPERWRKGDFRRRRDGKWCFCAVGALLPSADVADEFEEVYDELWALNVALSDTVEVIDIQMLVDFVAYFNDDNATKHADVMDLYDKAVALAEAA